ncbi:Stores iron in a soluble, non-toxic, readily available form [Actinomortierella ambigua]|nr:Stores iron in a soluble, non-toxic, readily available form [Actinomortierella ambigua]
MSIARQNFSEGAESYINQQVNLQLTAAQTFRQIAAYFSQSDVALPGLAKNFSKRASKETERAQYWIHYQNERGGTVVLNTIPAPSPDWSSAREALGNSVEAALQIERDVNKNFLAVSSLADDNDDPQLANTIRSVALAQQVDTIEHLARDITQHDRAGNGLGLYLFDKNLEDEV